MNTLDLSFFILVAAVALVLFLVLLVLFRPKTTKRPVKLQEITKEQQARYKAARKAAQDYRLRAAIFYITDTSKIANHKLETLSKLEFDGKLRGDAERNLALLAAAKHPDANVLINLKRTKKKLAKQAGAGRNGKPNSTKHTVTSWTATACKATPRMGFGSKAYTWRKDAVVVDGSNVIHWESDNSSVPPSWGPLTSLLETLKGSKIAAKVIFDASIGYRVADRHMRPKEIAKILNAKVEIVPSGTVADERIIEFAQENLVPIVSNDNFKDWPESQWIPKHKGFFVNGKTELLEVRA